MCRRLWSRAPHYEFEAFLQTLGAGSRAIRFIERQSVFPLWGSNWVRRLMRGRLSGLSPRTARQMKPLTADDRRFRCRTMYCFSAGTHPVLNSHSL